MQHPIEALFARYQQTGKPRLLGQVYDETSARLWPLALQLTRDHALAEDLLQNTYLLAIERHGQWNPEVPLLEWLTGLLAECHLDRTLPTVTLIPEEASRRIPSEASNPVSTALAAELDQQLCAALAQLPDRYRVVLELKIREGKDSAEIGALVGKSAGTVRSQIARGLERLRMLLPTTASLGWLWSRRAEGAQGLSPEARVRKSLLDRHPTPWVPTSLGLTTVIGALSLLGVAALTAHGWPGNAPAHRDVPASVPATQVALPSGPSDLAEAPVPITRQAVHTEPETMAPPADVHLTGRVLDERGAPVANANVQLFSWRDWRPDWQPDPLPKPSIRRGWQTSTDGEGRFRFEVPAPQGTEAIVEFEAGDWYTRETLWLGAAYSGLEPLESGPRDLGVVRLSHAGVLEASLRDADGQPIPWAGVHVTPGQHYGTGSMVNSDAHGRVRLPKVLPGWQTILVTKDLVELRLPPLAIGPGATSELQEWRWPKVESVRISMRTPEGAPVEGVPFGVIYPGPPRLRMPGLRTSDAQGELMVELPVGAPMWLEARPERDLPVAQRVIVRGPGEHFVFTLPELSSARLIVVHALDGSPLNDAHVELRPTTGRHRDLRSARPSPLPDQPGVWALPQAADTEVRVRAIGFVTQTIAWSGSEEDLRVALQPASTLEGIVMQAGKPQAGVRLEAAYDHDGYDQPHSLRAALADTDDDLLARLSQTHSDDVGRFSITLASEAEGAVLMQAFGPNGGAQQRWPLTSLHAPRTLELKPYAVLRGRVWLPEGLSPAGLTVFLNASRGTLRATLDSDGRYEMTRVPAGHHRVQMLPTEALHGRQVLAKVDLAPGEVRQCDLDLRHLGRTGVAVSVLDALGAPLPRIAVALVPASVRDATPPEQYVLGRTRPQGTLLGRAMAKGPCAWWVKPPGSPSWTRLDLPTAYVTMEPLPEVTLRIP